MKCRMMAAAMLFHDDELLMMERSMSRTLNPGMWAAVGGHLEPDELSRPRHACLREIQEETGFGPDDIADLKLRYILLRNKEGELRQQFIYSGRALRRDFVDTDEGDLHWVPVAEVLDRDRDIPYIYRKTLEHYFRTGPCDHVWVGVANLDPPSGQPRVDWVPLTDPNY
ncbi:NUDIX domain-containing protein [Paenibacillus hodogayensis]|uniref:NUDIX domain-containing protein n=1 Tax=Paenibacillus hodogayensis TaxID=279208 RepID=A0ABV5VVS2_9BACL